MKRTGQLKNHSMKHPVTWCTPTVVLSFVLKAQRKGEMRKNRNLAIVVNEEIKKKTQTSLKLLSDYPCLERLSHKLGHIKLKDSTIIVLISLRDGTIVGYPLAQGSLRPTRKNIEKY